MGDMTITHEIQGTIFSNKSMLKPAKQPKKGDLQPESGRIAQEQQVDAVWPGWGSDSQNLPALTFSTYNAYKFS